MEIVRIISALVITFCLGFLFGTVVTTNDWQHKLLQSGAAEYNKQGDFIIKGQK